MPKEARLWNSLKTNLKNQLHLQRIGTGITASGVPDVNCCYEGKEFWIELKSIKGNQLTLSPMQIAWMSTRAKFGGTCYVLVQKQREIKLFRVVDLAQLKTLTWKSEPILHLESPYEWELLFKTLVGNSFTR